jgi:hypothetical protein
MSYREVMDMPLRAFWTYTGAINRIRAEAELRQLQVLIGPGSGDAYKEVAASLEKEYGTPSVCVDNRRDENATEKLRSIFG